MGNVITYSFGMEQLHEVVRKAEARKTFEQHRDEYADALKKAGVTNTRFEHNPDWRNSVLSVQNIGDEWRGMVRTIGGPITAQFRSLESDLFWLGFDVAAWRAGLTWTNDEKWEDGEEGSNGSSSESS